LRATLPAISSPAAVVLCRDPLSAMGGVTLCAKAGDAAFPPVSLTKLVSAMVALDAAAAYGLDPTTWTITRRRGDAAPVGSSGNNLRIGDVLTLRDAIANMLLPSSNVCARVVAREIGTVLLAGATGDPATRFVEAMNTKASSLLATRSLFENPDGWPEASQITTAEEMARITLAAADYPLIASLWGQATYKVTITGPNARVIPIISSVDMIRRGEPDILGGKTGTIAGETFNLALHVAMPAGNRVAVVILGAASNASRFADARSIIDAVQGENGWSSPMPAPITRL
jgi:D-alanyl-D-alanine carboxypeptidase